LRNQSKTSAIIPFFSHIFAVPSVQERNYKLSFTFLFNQFLLSSTKKTSKIKTNFSLFIHNHMRKYLDHDVTETLKTQNTSFSFILRGEKSNNSGPILSFCGRDMALNFWYIYTLNLHKLGFVHLYVYRSYII